jgi:hypothetical protein
MRTTVAPLRVKPGATFVAGSIRQQLRGLTDKAIRRGVFGRVPFASRICRTPVVMSRSSRRSRRASEGARAAGVDGAEQYRHDQVPNGTWEQ